MENYTEIRLKRSRLQAWLGPIIPFQCPCERLASQLTGNGHIWKVAESWVPGIETCHFGFFGAERSKRCFSVCFFSCCAWEMGSCSGKDAIQLDKSNFSWKNRAPNVCFVGACTLPHAMMSSISQPLSPVAIAIYKTSAFSTLSTYFS